MANGFKYDAFISYRHSELDKFVAENLHKKLESYKVSKKVISNGRTSRSRIERVFRDKDELPITNNLEDPIIKALGESEYLIVICTPRLKESIWCKKEIETFISMHGRDKIFAVLAEGEPHESFPEEILYRDEQIQYPDGTIGTRVVPAEPLAADVRGKTKKEILKAMDVEILRLLAPMLGVDFDDLKQRHRERKFKKIITATVASAAVCLGIGIASTITALHINKQKKQIEEQSLEIQAQASEIASQSDAIQVQNQQLLLNQAKNLAEESDELLNDGLRKEAIEKATIALTSENDIAMPYTPEARYALTESLYIYSVGSGLKPITSIDTIDTVVDYCYNQESGYLACVDEQGIVSVWDSNTWEEVTNVIPDEEIIGLYNGNISFLNSNTIIFPQGDDGLCVYDIETGEKKDKECDVYNIKVAPDGSYVVNESYTTLDILKVEGKELEEKYSITPKEGYYFGTDLYVLENDLLVYWEYLNTGTDYVYDQPDRDMTDNVFLHMFDMNTCEEVAQLSLEYDTVDDVILKDSQIIFAVTRYNRSSSTMLVSYDINEKKVVWEAQTSDGVKEIFTTKDMADKFVTYDGSYLYIYDSTTGEEKGLTVLENPIIGLKAIEDYDGFALFTSGGEYGEYHSDFDEVICYPEYFINDFNKIVSYVPGEYGYIIQPENDNKLVYYENAVGADIAEYTGEEKIWNTGILEENCYEVATTVNPSKATLAECIMYSNDEKYMFISYTDSTVEIYDAKTQECVKVLDNISDGLNQYLGYDKNGNMYVADTEYGYILDQEFNLIGRVEELIGVDDENNLLVVEAFDGLYTFPIYSTEELINIAKKILG